MDIPCVHERSMGGCASSFALGKCCKNIKCKLLLFEHSQSCKLSTKEQCGVSMCIHLCVCVSKCLFVSMSVYYVNGKHAMPCSACCYLCNGHYVLFVCPLNNAYHFNCIYILQACGGNIKEGVNINEGYPRGAPSKNMFLLAGGTIAVYMILVPAVLFTAPGVPVSK